MGQCSGQGRGFLLRALTFLPSAVFTRQHQEKSQVGWTAARRRRAATAHWATAPQPILFDVCSARGCLQPVCTAQRCLQCAAMCTACKVVCTMQGCLQHVEILAVLEDICSMLGTFVQTGMLVVHGGICGSPWCLQPVGMLAWRCMEVFAVHRNLCIIQGCLRHAGTFTALCRTQRHRQQLFSLAPTLCLSFPLPETKQSTGAIGTGASCTIAFQPFIPPLNPPASTPKMPFCKAGWCKAQPAGEGCQQQGDV